MLIICILFYFRACPEFNNALLELEAESICGSLPLQSYIALPMQRVTRYPLLMSAVQSCVPNTHPLSVKLSETINNLRKVSNDLDF